MEHLQNLKDGFIYGIEVDLTGEQNYPIISLTRYQFDFNEWNRTPGISDHWIFWDPFRVDRFFDITYENGVLRSIPLEKAKSRYWGLQSAVTIDIPLLTVTSPDDISTKIFQELENLPLIKN